MPNPSWLALYNAMDATGDTNRAVQGLQQIPQQTQDPVLDKVQGAMGLPVVGGAFQGAAGLMEALGGAPVIGGALNAMAYPGQALRGVGLRHQMQGDTIGGVPSVNLGIMPQDMLQNVQQLLGSFQSIGMGLGDLGADTLKYGPGGAIGHAVDQYNDIPISGAKLGADVALDPMNTLGFTHSIPGLRNIPKVGAAEKAAQGYVTDKLEQVGGAALGAAKAGTQKLGRIHPGFATLLEQSPRARVAMENDRVVNLLGHLANTMGQENSGRLLADLYSSHTGVAEDAQAAMQARMHQLLDAAGRQGPHTISPEESTHTLLNQLPGFDPAHAQELGNELPRLFALYDRDRALLRTLEQRVGWTGGNPRDTGELASFAARKGFEGDAAEIQRLGGLWKGTDLYQAAEDEAVTSRYLRRYAHTQGLAEPGDLEKGWKEVIGAWRQQALFWPSYWINNLGDAVTKGETLLGTHGMGDLPHNMAGVAGKFGEDVTQSLTDLFAEHPNLAPLAEHLSPIIESIHNSPRYARAVAAQHTMGPVWEQHAARTGIRKPPAEILQGGLSNEIGGIKGIGARPKQGFERLPVMGRLFELARESSEAVESSARTAAYIKGSEDLLRTTAQDLGGKLDAALSHGGLSAKARADVLDHFHATEGVTSPQQVAQWAAAAGADDEAVAAVMREMGQAQSAAYQAGVKTAHHIHFDYRDTTNLDEHLRNIAGFHFWATRQLPLYTEIMATHPGLLSAFQRMENESNQYRQEEGDTSPRLQNTIPTFGPGRQLAHLLFGRDGELFWDPRRLLSLVDQPGNLRNPSKGETPVGRVLDAISTVGVSPNPFLQIPLNMAGVYGARQPGDLLRTTGLINAAVREKTGQPFDLEAPLHAVQKSRPLNALGAGQPEPVSTDDLIRWRLRELSVEAHGVPNAPEYRAAMHEGDRNPLWQEAVRSMGSQAVREKLMASFGASTRFYSDAAHTMDLRKAERTEA